MRELCGDRTAGGNDGGLEQSTRRRDAAMRGLPDATTAHTQRKILHVRVVMAAAIFGRYTACAGGWSLRPRRRFTPGAPACSQPPVLPGQLLRLGWPPQAYRSAACRVEGVCGGAAAVSAASARTQELWCALRQHATRSDNCHERMGLAISLRTVRSPVPHAPCLPQQLRTARALRFAVLVAPAAALNVLPWRRLRSTPAAAAPAARAQPATHGAACVARRALRCRAAADARGLRRAPHTQNFWRRRGGIHARGRLLRPAVARGVRLRRTVRRVGLDRAARRAFGRRSASR